MLLHAMSSTSVTAPSSMYRRARWSPTMSSINGSHVRAAVVPIVRMRPRERRLDRLQIV